ncbi:MULTISPECIES: GNAT family N-acetyltransferase [Paenibacillus]|uniref:GNAT family N-acetyltransferase n=1 Tax=Paenibacillus TaxID=44249 RepID=UPI0022B8EAEC|nr:GNAT family N-acetyltransferase [Paenibacillus caseinilyticus]MCZ8523996.1 GNAT family N-acetyltransferase [Paenibacillus caseinilyticus]
MSPVCPEDEPLLYSLYAASRQEELDALGWGPQERVAFLSMQYRLQQQAYRAQYPAAVHLIIAHEEQRMGQMRIDRSDRELRLVDLSLLPQWRGQGMGTGILRELQSEARAEDRSIRLSVLEGNPARRLYEGLGFETDGEPSVYRQMLWKP